MPKSLQVVVLTSLSLAVTVPVAHAQSAKKLTACALLSAAEIRRITGRADVATGAEEPENMEGHSNCIRSGAFDLGITISSDTRLMFERMRDTYAKAPPRLGYRIERVPGIGDQAYFLTDKDRVQLKSLRGETELTIALTKISSFPGKMPPEPEAKAIALKLAQAGVAKLR